MTTLSPGAKLVTHLEFAAGHGIHFAIEFVVPFPDEEFGLPTRLRKSERFDGHYKGQIVGADGNVCQDLAPETKGMGIILALPLFIGQIGPRVGKK